MVKAAIGGSKNPIRIPIPMVSRKLRVGSAVMVRISVTIGASAVPNSEM